MKIEMTYLSDEELEQLIFAVEQQELVAAPPELMEKILESVEERQESNKLSDNKVREFRSYCFRVLTSVAAAVVLVFLLPAIRDIPLPEGITTGTIVASGRDAGKENVWNNSGILMQTFNGVTIFDNHNKFNFFNEKNGGIFNETKER